MILGRPDRPKEATFDLTPMIDVVLLLIIFFTLTSQFAKSQQSPVDLPKEAGEPGAPTHPASLVLDLDATGTLKADGNPIEFEALSAMIGAQATKEGTGADKLELIIRADRACPAAHLNRLAEALSRLGVRTWKLTTNPAGAPGRAGGG